MTEDFEYKVYFEIYKENTMLCHMRFKRKFKKKHPKANVDIDKLIIEIERYQINKYGCIKFSDFYIEKVDKERAKNRSKQRHSYNLKERNRIKK